MFLEAYLKHALAFYFVRRILGIYHMLGPLTVVRYSYRMKNFKLCCDILYYTIDWKWCNLRIPLNFAVKPIFHMYVIALQYGFGTISFEVPFGDRNLFAFDVENAKQKWRNIMFKNWRYHSLRYFGKMVIHCISGHYEGTYTSTCEI